jgi:hypothetical protein
VVLPSLRIHVGVQGRIHLTRYVVAGQTLGVVATLRLIKPALQDVMLRRFTHALVLGVVGAHGSRAAVLFLARIIALGAGAARIHQAAHTRAISHLVTSAPTSVTMPAIS